jgi:hydrogenase-4 component B
MMDGGAWLLEAALATLFAAVPASVLGRRVSYAVSFVGSALLLAAAVVVLVSGPFTALQYTGPFGETETLGLDALSAFFALAAAVVWMGASAFSISYDERPGGGLARAFALTLGSIAVLFAAGNFLLFLAAWEGMTLASFWMILEATGRKGPVFSAGFVFLAFGEGSTLLVALSVAGFHAATGTFAMVDVLALPVSTGIFLCALVGFGLKMGVAPFHMSEWLPIAHSSAPSNASSVLSATLTLAGVYGLFRVISLLPVGPVWWGAVVLAIGAISALLGALFASVSEHVKGLPAYSTIENNGLVLVALGVALVARSQGLEILYAFALFAAFFQALAHAVAKGALFLFTGYVEHVTGTFDLNEVRGRALRGSPGASLGGLISGLSFAAAAPLAGFVGEWMILEALFQSYRFAGPAAEFLGLLAGAAVALSLGLALVAMVKLVGFSLLWNPLRASSPRPTPGLGAPLAALSGVVIALGVGAPWVLTFIAPAVQNLSHQALSAPVGQLLDLPTGWSILSGSPFGILSPPAVPIGIALGSLVGLGYFLLGGGRAARRVPVWVSGRAPSPVGGTYTAFGFSTGIRIMLGSLLGTREVQRRSGGITAVAIASPEVYNVELEVLDVFKLFYDDLVLGGLAFSRALKAFLMPGRPGRYLAYVLITVLVVLVYLTAAG